jgi:hypothetical protein
LEIRSYGLRIRDLARVIWGWISGQVSIFSRVQARKPRLKYSHALGNYYAEIKIFKKKLFP